jgi:hypothetical protein
MRTLILWFYRITGKFPQLALRVDLFEVGTTGHGPTVIDKSVAEKRGLKPLNRFERWLVASVVPELQKHHHDAFRQACIEVLGEDPDEWGEF